jgi:hypothetical protein
MSNTHDQALTPVAAEVLELGQALFDTVIDAAAAPPPVEGETREPFPTDDVRAAAEEFFIALRVLLQDEDKRREKGMRLSR